MRIVVAPDSYKGCLSALSAARAMERGVKRVFPEGRVEVIPMADGGEGTVDAVLAAAGGEKVKLTVSDPLGRPVEAVYGLLDQGRTAVIEMAAASGLPLLTAEERNPLVTTTRGTGELIKDALDKGVGKILIGIGGSATNDGGAGMAQALGAKLLDARGLALGPGGAELARLTGIELADLHPRVQDVEFEVACDVQNPLCGPQGASAVYGPQKGATAEMVRELDQALANWGRVLGQVQGRDLLGLPGGGAAGGLGAGLVGLLGASLRSGSEIVLEAAGAREKMAGADLVLTGEGKTDFQTGFGKVPAGVAAYARQAGVPVLVLSGAVEGDPNLLAAAGIEACLSIAEGPTSLGEALSRAEAQLERAVWRTLLVWKLGYEARHST
ncbi:glycerate 3-kinase [Acididesulfobacillus acetoxydans]|uniref:Glycerate 3-kinase n=1 Tax=Acididesulfobacillus acetoxydans TaxID=1561005 RepID=A0A8S0X0B1_9FIRM|nr:glycerate kinase [Acididesulfobacillus acetoxydans]CAA7602481.1 glycerate 3-kinase [Acididesulfobacillus acetoxydans]CEJ05936.1 Glycerate kinase [Acididesulfobacillus acetoxydans]